MYQYKICHNVTNLAFSDIFVCSTSVYSLRSYDNTIGPFNLLPLLIGYVSQLLQYRHFFINRIPAIYLEYEVTWRMEHSQCFLYLSNGTCRFMHTAAYMLMLRPH